VKKRFHCPEPKCGKTTQSFVTMHTHVIYKHDLRPSEARSLILSNLSKLQDVKNETGTEGRERLYRLIHRAASSRDSEGSSRLRQRIGR